MIVTVEVPAVAALPAVSVNTLLALAGFALHAAVTPAGKPLAARLTLSVNPFISLTVTVAVLLLSASTDNLKAEVDSVNFAPLTARCTVVVSVIEPEVPAIVTGYVPAAVALLAVNVNTLELLVEAGVKAAVTPAGNEEAIDRSTLPVNPLAPTTEIVAVELEPATTLIAPFEAASQKPEESLPASASISDCPAGEPQPVTKS